MEPDFRRKIRDKYYKPYKRNMVFLISCLILIYLLIVSGLLFTGDPENKISVTPFVVVTIGFLAVFWLSWPKFRKMNIHYKQDAEFGMIVKEQTAVIRVFPTPAGINIYWLDSDSIKTFTPDPYFALSEGNNITIYYLKFSKEYLAYEL